MKLKGYEIAVISHKDLTFELNFFRKIKHKYFNKPFSTNFRLFAEALNKIKLKIKKLKLARIECL